MSEYKGLSDPIAIRIPVDVLSDVERIAQISERTRSWVIVRALKSYLAAEGREILDVANGREEIRNGRSHDLDDVLDEIEGRPAKGAAA